MHGDLEYELVALVFADESIEDRRDFLGRELCIIIHNNQYMHPF
jgi:hypothetical protein